MSKRSIKRLRRKKLPSKPRETEKVVPTVYKKGVKLDPVKSNEIPLDKVDGLKLPKTRLLAERLGVPVYGNLADVKRRIKKKLVSQQGQPKLDPGDSVSTAAFNTDTGSTATAQFKDEDKVVSVIDKDIEPMKSVRIESDGSGIYTINQESMIGEDEEVIVTVVPTKEAAERELKSLKVDKMVKETVKLEKEIKQLKRELKNKSKHPKTSRKPIKPRLKDTQGLSSGSISRDEFKQVGFEDNRGILEDEAPVEAIQGVSSKKGKELRAKGLKTVKKVRKAIKDKKGVNL